MPPRDPKPANSRRRPNAQARRTGTSTHRDAREVLRPAPARFRPASHPNQGQLAQALPQPAAERSPKAQNAWLPAKPGTGRNRMAAGHVRRRHRTQDHPKDVGLYWPCRPTSGCKPPWTPPADQRPTDLIIRNPDGEPTRVSWLDTNGELMHRPFDGAFPADYPADLAVRQCTEVACRLLVYPSNSARDRAHTMLYMAEAGLHSFDYDSGR